MSFLLPFGHGSRQWRKENTGQLLWFVWWVLVWQSLPTRTEYSTIRVIQRYVCFRSVLKFEGDIFLLFLVSLVYSCSFFILTTVYRGIEIREVRFADELITLQLPNVSSEQAMRHCKVTCNSRKNQIDQMRAGFQVCAYNIVKHLSVCLNIYGKIIRYSWSKKHLKFK